MNKEISVYTELDSWFDYRKGLIFKIIADQTLPTQERLEDADNKWTKFAKKMYEERRFEIFRFPGLDVTPENFKEAYDNRSINDFLYYMPSNLGNVLLKTVMETEASYDQLTNIKSFSIIVNTFPYVLTNEQSQELVRSLRARFKGRHEIKLIHKDAHLATPSFYRSFNYVYKYDLFLNDNKAFMDNIKTEPITETVFFVPDVLLKPVENITGKPADVLRAMGLTLAAIFSFEPIPHWSYDHTN